MKFHRYIAHPLHHYRYIYIYCSLSVYIWSTNMPKFTHIQYMHTFIVSLVCKQYFYTKTCCFFPTLEKKLLKYSISSNNWKWKVCSPFGKFLSHPRVLREMMRNFKKHTTQVRPSVCGMHQCECVLFEYHLWLFMESLFIRRVSNHFSTRLRFVFNTLLKKLKC